MKELAAMLALVICRLDYIQMVVERAFEEVGATKAGLTFEDFKEAMKDSKFQMQVEVPTDV